MKNLTLENLAKITVLTVITILGIILITLAFLDPEIPFEL